MKQVTASGKTVDEAVQSALARLKALREDTDVQIIDEPKRGLFGLFGSKRAVVQVTMKEDDLQIAVDYIQAIAKQMEIDLEIKASKKDKDVHLELNAEKIAMLIGKRGQTLNALETLVQLVMNNERRTYYNVTLDAEKYRERRKETLITLGEKMASKALYLQKKVALEPMPSFERKIIHHVLENRSDIATESEGREPHRYIVIMPKA